ncbi:cholesterol 24-hydroxylase-like [Asterias rubens]|uniref:cholesterol 24-hydroxylase-like n=1 Tax=Asterias rubens TaxID=7604 RepID=UPI0014559A19|nr:cholesterol 24-hydroxylase-like [Asterias rubens]
MIVLNLLLASLVGFPLVVFGSLFVASVLYLHYVHVKYSHVPGPKRKSFFTGNIADLRQAVTDGRVFEDVFFDWNKEFGQVFIFYVFHRAIVHVYIPEVVREILVSDNYPKCGNGYKAMESLYGQRFMGRGLVTEIDHEVWKPQAAMFSPTFHRNYLKTCIVQFNSSSDALIECLYKKADGKTEVNMMDMFNMVSLDSISKVAFGQDMNVFSKEKSTFCTDCQFLQDSVLISLQNPLLWLSPFKDHIKLRREVRAASKRMREIGRQCIMGQMEALKQGEKLDNNILSHILQSAAPAGDSNVIDLELMIDHFVTFFLAGQETTACLMASTLLELGRHPEIVYKMKTEVDAVLGDDGYVSFEDLSKLKYTTAVLKETLRFHCPVTSVMRTTPKEVVWNGIKLPTDTLINVCIMNLARQKEYFENPEEFMPSRFLGGDNNNNMYIPFSLGPRKCIGKQFAMIEAQVVMAKLVKNLTFDLVPGQSFNYVRSITCKPKDSCRVYVKPAVPKSDIMKEVC